MAKIPVTKYRPVLTASQILHVLKLAKTESPISEASFQLIAQLAPFAAKIDAAAITPAYSTTPRVSLLESLGESNITASSAASSNSQANYQSKEELWEAAYNKVQSLGAASCTLQELRDSQEYAYLNDLMSSEELAAFEASNN